MANEIDTMQALAKALDALDDEGARLRVITWAASKYAPSVGVAKGKGGGEEAPGEDFADFPSLFDATDPKTDANKALVAAYWHQTSQGQSDLDSLTLNTALKNMGHGVGNITDALTGQMKKKPALILQVGKSGKAKQGRKKYRVTSAGVKAVQAMIKSAHEVGNEEDA